MKVSNVIYYLFGSTLIFWGLSDLKELSDLRKYSWIAHQNRIASTSNPSMALNRVSEFGTFPQRFKRNVVPGFLASACVKIALGAGIIAFGSYV